MILDLMTRKFPPKLTPPAAVAVPSASAGASKEETKDDKQEAAKEVKLEKAEASAAPGSQASTAGIKREAGQISSRGPEPKKSKMS